MDQQARVAGYNKRCESSLHCDTYCDARKNLRQCQMTGDCCNHGTDPKSVPDYKTQIRCDKCKESKSCCKEETACNVHIWYGSLHGEDCHVKKRAKEYTMGCVPKEQFRKEEYACNKGKKQNCKLHCYEERHCRGLLIGSCGGSGPSLVVASLARPTKSQDRVFICLALLLQ